MDICHHVHQQELLELGLVLLDVVEIGNLGKGGVGRRKDGERAGTLQGGDQVRGLEGCDEGGQGWDRCSRVDEVLDDLPRNKS